MKNSLYISRTILSYPIDLTMQWIGEDILLTVTGGVKKHIGSISIYKPSTEQDYNASILLPKHRDNVVSDHFAKVISKKMNTTVTVICGIHYDSPGEDGINQILACTDNILEELVSML